MASLMEETEEAFRRDRDLLYEFQARLLRLLLSATTSKPIDLVKIAALARSHLVNRIDQSRSAAMGLLRFIRTWAKALLPFQP